ncbi:hypothetical protein V3C99_019080, partial [Haemonchus contortus]
LGRLIYCTGYYSGPITLHVLLLRLDSPLVCVCGRGEVAKPMGQSSTTHFTYLLFIVVLFGSST